MKMKSKVLSTALSVALIGMFSPAAFAAPGHDGPPAPPGPGHEQEKEVGHGTFSILVESMSQPATCESGGYNVYGCTGHYGINGEGWKKGNGHYETVATESLGHHLVETEYVAETCGTDGYSKLECDRDGCDKIVETTIPATGNHSYGEPVVVEATYDTEGSKTWTCGVCGDVKTETIPAKERDPEPQPQPEDKTKTQDVYVYLKVVGNTEGLVLNGSGWYTIGKVSANLPDVSTFVAGQHTTQYNSSINLSNISRFAANSSLDITNADFSVDGYGLVRVDSGANDYVSSGSCFHYDGTIDVAYLPHYQINYTVDGEYLDSVSGAGIPDQVVNIDFSNCPTGYEYTGAETSLTLPNSNDTVVVNINYTKCEYDITYVIGEHGTTTDQIAAKQKYGDTTLKAPEIAVEDGYIFTGWTPQISQTVTGSATYVAQYEQKKPEDKYHTVTWKNDDGSVIKTDQIKDGNIAAYDGNTPTKASDSKYDYTFAGWNKESEPITEDTEYIATYTKSPVTYTLTIQPVDTNGNPIGEPIVRYVKYNEEYDVEIPIIDGYTYQGGAIHGTMSDSDNTINLVYKKDEIAPVDPDPEPIDPPYVPDEPINPPSDPDEPGDNPDDDGGDEPSDDPSDDNEPSDDPSDNSGDEPSDDDSGDEPSDDPSDDHNDTPGDEPSKSNDKPENNNSDGGNAVINIIDDNNNPLVGPSEENEEEEETDVIDDNDNHLVTEDISCYVHWLMIIAAILNTIYGAGVIINRKRKEDDNEEE